MTTTDRARATAGDAPSRSHAAADARALFERLEADVAERGRAVAAGGVAHYGFAGTTVAVRCAGNAAREWTRLPFGAATDPCERDVELRVDVASGPRVLPAACARADAAGAIVSDDRYVVHALPAMAAGLDRARGRLVAVLRGVAELPHWERAKPLATLLGVWCHDRGVRVVHAGMAARDGSGVLFVGQSGAGKSTAALACLAAGFDFLGDDCVGLRARDDGAFEGVRLYATATLERSHLEGAVLPGERASGPSDARDKTVVTPGVRRPERIASSAPVRAILMPRLTDAPRTTLRRASGREALLALAPGSIVRRAAPGAALLGDLARIVRALPCWWLEMSTRPDEIPGCVERVLREVEPS